MALIIKFMANYFFNPGQFPDIPCRDQPACDEFLFDQGPTKGLGKIQFHDYTIAYDRADLPNVNVFKQQIGLLREMLLKATPDKVQAKNMDFLLYLGEMFTLVAYGQLILEKFFMDGFEEDLLEQIFDFMIRDFSEYALKLYSKTDTSEIQMGYCQKMIKRPITDLDRFSRIWEGHVISLKDNYEMNP
jgi:acyl-CoA dehydrogenase